MLDSTTPLAPPPVRQPRSRKQIVMIISVAVALLVVLGVAVFFGIQALKKDGSSGSVKKTTDIFAPDLTKTNEPASPITIGKARYQSPCRLLPEWSFEAIFGKIEDTGKRSESYLYKSPDQPTYALSAYTPDSRCSITQNLAATSVSITPTYYTSEGYATQAWASSLPYSTSDKAYKTLVGLKDKLEADVKAGALAQSEADPALTVISRTMDSTKKKADAFKSGDFLGGSMTTESGINSLIFEPQAKVFVWREGSALMRLSVPFDADIVKNSSLDIAALASKDLSTVFTKSQKASSVVSKNFTNQSLPQGPASAYFARTDGTKKYHPCMLLDIPLIESTTGQAVSAGLDQDSTYYNPEVVIPMTSKKTNQKYKYPNSNSCEAKFGANFTTGAGGTVQLDVSYPSDEQRAKEVYGYLKEPFDTATSMSLSQGAEGLISTGDTCSSAGTCSSTMIARKGQVFVKLFIMRNVAVSLSQDQQTKMMQRVLDQL